MGKVRQRCQGRCGQFSPSLWVPGLELRSPGLHRQHHHAGSSCCGPVINNCGWRHSIILLPHISLKFGLLSCQLVAYTEMYKSVVGILNSSYSGHSSKNLFSLHFIFLYGILALILLPAHSDKLLLKDPSRALCEY